MNQSERFALLLAELDKATPAHDQASARLLLEETMNRIENAHSGVPFDPANWMKDGRLYPPHDDQQKVSPVSGTSLFFSRKHRIWFGDNGSIRIASGSWSR